MMELFGEPIYTYTRRQALEDGVLVDAGPLAAEAGIRFPVALTRAAWEATVTVPAGADGFQNATGRLWDVLYVGRCAMARSTGDRAAYTISVITTKGGKRRNIRLEAVCGPGDNAEPVITIMLPGED